MSGGRADSTQRFPTGYSLTNPFPPPPPPPHYSSLPFPLLSPLQTSASSKQVDNLISATIESTSPLPAKPQVRPPHKTDKQQFVAQNTHYLGKGRGGGWGAIMENSTQWPYTPIFSHPFPFHPITEHFCC